MKSLILTSLSVALIAALVAVPESADARGFGGFRGGGGFHGGGFRGGGFRSGGFGGGGFRSGGFRSGGFDRGNFRGNFGGNRGLTTRSPSFSFRSGSSLRRPSSGLSLGSRPSIHSQSGIFQRPEFSGNREGSRFSSLRPESRLEPTRPGNRFPGLNIGNRRPVELPGLGDGRLSGARSNIGNRIGQRQPLSNVNRPDMRSARSDRLQQRLDSRYSRQGQRQGNRGDRQQARRNDYHNWYNDYYHHHYAWYHGSWHGGFYFGWGGYWGYMWNRYPVLMGFNTTLWGLNRIGYWWGYQPYNNVYYTGGTTVVNYNTPVLAQPPYNASTGSSSSTNNGQTPLPPGVSQKGMFAFNAAQKQFKEGNYKQALAAINLTLTEIPRDAVANEFRALVLFALGDYKHSAETLYAVLSVGPGWDWTTLSGLYGNVNDYTKQLRALESYVDSNPNDPAGHFVLGYQYLTCGYKDAAIKQYQQALKLNPKDTVSADMLKMLGATKPPKYTPPSNKKPPTVPLASLVGNWTATRGDSSFAMNLTKDKNFTWTYTKDGKKTQVKGVFAVDGDSIAMEPDAGGVMVATIKLQQPDELSFKMAGDEKTPGLTFKK